MLDAFYAADPDERQSVVDAVLAQVADAFDRQTATLCAVALAVWGWTPGEVADQLTRDDANERAALDPFALPVMLTDAERGGLS